MKPVDRTPVEPPPKTPENFEPFDEDYPMDAEEEQESMSQEACDDFDEEARDKSSSRPSSSTTEKRK